jgi:uncharacterized phage protein (TIGR01671 family)
MQRVIKFRAWNRFGKEMFESVQDKEFDGFLYGTQIEVMQFTGLKDKNGVEIYEGDIVKTHTGRLWMITYHEDSMGFILDSDPMNRDAEARRVSSDREQRKAIYMEVIGNIYENPELLKS